MVSINDIARDETIDDARALAELGLDEEQAARQLHESAGLVVGVPHGADERIAYYRQCLSIPLASQFGLPGTVGRLRVAMRKVEQNEYPGA